MRGLASGELVKARDRLRPFVEKARGFRGWSLEEVAPTRIGPGYPWDYRKRAADLIVRASAVLDMGTGGGELFADLCRGRRGRAVATEPWHVNAPIAKSRLAPLGVEVVGAHSLHLPFRNDVFDLVLDRHEEMDPAEVGRVLARGGIVLTQQVGRNDWEEVRTFFPRMQDSGPLFARYVSGFEGAGMKIERSESPDTRGAYHGPGVIGYILCVAPWLIPPFDPLGQDLRALIQLERNLTTHEGLVLTESRFLIEASKPS